MSLELAILLVFMGVLLRFRGVFPLINLKETKNEKAIFRFDDFEHDGIFAGDNRIGGPSRPPHANG
jgi:hypothetical protein